MTITDSCPCGARFQMVTGTGFGAVNPDERKTLSDKHTEWLAAHASCRERNASDHSD